MFICVLKGKMAAPMDATSDSNFLENIKHLSNIKDLTKTYDDICKEEVLINNIIYFIICKI